MAVETALYSLITTDSTIKALIGDRLYPLVIPQDASLPACAYQVITTIRSYHHGGQSAIASPRIQITISAASKAAANSVAAALRRRLSGYKGTVGAVQIGSIFIENEYDGFNLDTQIVTVRQDYRVSWKEV